VRKKSVRLRRKVKKGQMDAATKKAVLKFGGGPGFAKPTDLLTPSPGNIEPTRGSFLFGGGGSRLKRG